VFFSDTFVTNNPTVTLDDTIVTPTRVTADNSIYSYILSGNGGITGNTSLNKSGSGIFTLGTANNTYVGGTFITEGTLAMGIASALPVNGVLFMSGTGTLDLNGYNASVVNIAASAVANTITDNSAGIGTNTLSILNLTTTVNAVIKDGPSKAVAIGFANANTVTVPFPFNAANTFSGGVTLKHSTGGGTRLVINGAVTTVGTPGNIVSSPFGRGPIIIGEAETDKAGIYVQTATTIANDLIVNSTNGTDLIYALRLDVAGMNFSGKVTANSDLTFGSNGTGSSTLTNEISGAGGLRLVSAASATALTVTLSGPNTYTGKTTVNAGTLFFNTLGNVGEGASALGAPTTVANGTIDLNAIMRYNGATNTSDRVINVTVNNGDLYSDGRGMIILTGGITGANLTFRVRGSGTVVESGLITLGSGGVSRTDNGTLILSNPLNPFTGLLYVADGIISVNSIADSGQVSPLGAGTTIQLGQATATSGRLQFTGPAGGSCNRAFTISGTTAPSGGSIENTVAGQTLTLSGNFTGVGTTTLLQLVGAGDGVISGSINNTLSVLKGGSGTWTLAGTNFYTGTTTVSNGTLLVNGSTVAASKVLVNGGAVLGGSGSITGAVTVAAGGFLTAGGLNATNTLTLANGTGTALTLTNSTLLFDLPASGTACDRINITGASGKMVLNGSNTVALAFPYGPAPVGTYILMNCFGGMTTNAGASLVLQSPYPNATLSVVGGTNVVLTVTGASTYGLTWMGNISDVWDGGIQNWTNGSAAVAYAPGDNVTFDDMAVGFTVSSGSAVSPASVLFNNNVSNYTVSAAIAGDIPLIKFGAGALTLSGTNTYTGSTTIGGGTFTIDGAGLLGNGLYATNINNNGGGAFTYASSSTQTVSGVLSGPGDLVLSGSGTLTLSGVNTYIGATTVNGPGTLILSNNNAACTGPTVINGGVLKVFHANALGTATPGTIVNSDGTLELAGNITISEPITLFGTLSSQIGDNTYNGGITLLTGATFNVGSGSTIILATSTPNNANYGFTKMGAGTLRITADPNQRGPFVVNEGTLELQHGGGHRCCFHHRPRRDASPTWQRKCHC
jgi:autotransporter-associated beta strand protein